VTTRTAAMILALTACACGRAGTGGTSDAGCRGDGCAPTAGYSISFNRLWGAAPDDLWVVGGEGLLAHFDGRAWRRVASGTTATLRAITGRGRGDALIAGDRHTILRLRGTTWTREEPRRQGDAGALAQITEFHDVWMAANGEAWVAGGLTRPRQGGGDPVDSCVLGRHEKGRWRFDREDECGRIEALGGTGPNDVWARSGDAFVHWNGRSLVRYPRKDPPPRRGRHGFAGGWRLSEGRLVHPDRPPPPDGLATSGGYVDFWAFGADDLWAIAGGDLVHFDGRTWTNVPIPPP